MAPGETVVVRDYLHGPWREGSGEGLPTWPWREGSGERLPTWPLERG